VGDRQICPTLNRGFAQVFRLQLSPQTGGRIVLASDGLWDGLDPDMCPHNIGIEEVSRACTRCLPLSEREK
jgi:serine/threonine protein phosphatase PrpC